MGSAPQQMIFIVPGVVRVGLVVDVNVDALLVVGYVLAIVAILYVIGVRGDRDRLLLLFLFVFSSFSSSSP